MVIKNIPRHRNNPFSILMLGTQMATGGAQKVLLDQARWFHMHGHKVAVAFFYDKEGLHEKWREVYEISIYDLGAYRPGATIFAKAFSLITALWRLWKLLRQERFDVIETFTVDSNILGLPTAWLAGVPVRIATHHGIFDNLSPRRQKLHTLLVNLGFADTLVAVSQNTWLNALNEGIKKSKLVMISNGTLPPDTASVNKTETRKMLGIKTGELFIVVVGRLVYEKGHDILIRSLTRIISRFPNVKTGICGDGPLRSQLESQITKLALQDHVHLLGTWSNVSPALAVADIFVLPSRWEGLPMALLEAMAAGLPVVATRLEGIDEVITDGVHGLLVPPEDSDTLANSIIQLLSDAQLRKMMGEAGQARVLQSYTTDVMCQKYSDLMKDILEKKLAARR